MQFHRIGRRAAVLSLALFGLAHAGAPPAMLLTLLDTASGVSVTCNSAVPSSCGAGFSVTATTITFVGVLGSFNITGLTATNNPPGSTASSAGRTP